MIVFFYIKFYCFLTEMMKETITVINATTTHR